MLMIIGHVLAIAIGISLGLIGGGGSVLAVPILVYVMQIDPRTAIAMSLVVVGAVSVLGIIPHWRAGHVNWRIAAIFTPTAMLGAYAGARLASLPFISPTFQLIAFAVLMLVAGVFMIRDQGQATLTVHEPPLPLALMIPLEGLVVGILSGFVGIGGGFAIIPALVLLGKTPMKEAVGTSLVIIAFKSVTGFIGYLDQVTFDWLLIASFTVAASVGTLLGAVLNRRIKGQKLQAAFGYFIMAMGLFMLVVRQA